MKGLKKYIRRERRRYPRHFVSTEVEFYAWDALRKRTRSGRGAGRLTAISLKGACLQTNDLQIQDYHLFLDNDPDGGTDLAIEISHRSSQEPWVIHARVVSYDKFPEKREYQFDVRLQFVNASPRELKNLEQLIKALGKEKD